MARVPNVERAQTRAALITAARRALEWARTPGNHGGGNPYALEFVRAAERALARVERRECEDWARRTDREPYVIHGGSNG